MLDVNPDTVCRLIELARAFQEQDHVVLPEGPLDIDDARIPDLLEDHGDDPVLREFLSIVNDLEPDQQQQVTALFWIGRGDYDFDDWDESLFQAREAWTPTTGHYLIAHPLLAEYLTEGLALHGYSCE